MAKAVRWQIPFKSVGGTSYRIDIYDEGFSGTPVQLTGAQNVFTTNEDTDADFFAPVRTQSGIIRIVNQGAALMEQLLPTDAMSRPVRLVNLSNSNSIDWQGFLSPQAYDQRYVGFPVELELPVVSVLGAMGSIELYEGFGAAFVTILTHIAYAFGSLNRKCGIDNWFNNIYFPNRYFAAMRNCKLYQNFCWSAEEIINQENVTVDVHSVSCKELLRIIAQFFGCVVREQGRNIYITDVQNGGGARSYQYTSVSNLMLALIDQVTPLSMTAYTVSSNVNMSGLTWKSDAHKKSIQQGARRVRMDAALKEFDCDMSLPAVPFGNLVQGTLDTTVYANTNDQNYSLATYKYMQVQIYCPSSASTACTLTKVSDLYTLPYAQTAFWATNDFRTYYKELIQNPPTKTGTVQMPVCAYLSKWTDTDNVEHNGLMVCGFTKYLPYGDPQFGQYRLFTRFALTATNYIYKQVTPMVFAAHTGWLNINMRVALYNGIYGRGVAASSNPFITIAFKFGNKYWDKTNNAWTTSFTTMEFELDDKGNTKTNKTDDMDTKEDAGYFIPITSNMNGKIELLVYHEMFGYYDDIIEVFYSPVMEMLFEQLDVRYITPDSIVLSDRSVNNYAQVTGASFEEEKKVSVGLATDLYNDIRANMLYNNNGETVKLLSLDNVNVRPEVDLLNRMTAYYAAARRRLTIDVAHPTSSPVPTIQMNGINDGKKYLPLAESRDWAEDKSTITCFETVNA